MDSLARHAVVQHVQRPTFLKSITASSSHISLGAVVTEVALFHISNLGGQRDGKMYDGDPGNKIKHGQMRIHFLRYLFACGTPSINNTQVQIGLEMQL